MQSPRAEVRRCITGMAFVLKVALSDEQAARWNGFRGNELDAC